MERERWRDHHPLPAYLAISAQHRGNNRWPAGDVPLRADGVVWQRYLRRQYLSVTGTADEMRRGQVWTLPDQQYICLPVRAGFLLSGDQGVGGGVMSANGKPKIAFFDFTSCEGCQLTVVDSLQTHPELLQAVEIVQIREQAAIIVALGACAHLGGVNALKYLHPLDDVRRYVYGDQAEQYETYDVRPIEAVIPVDFTIPGCPIDRNEFVAVVKALLLGKKPPIPDYPLCVECKLKENTCLYFKG